MTKQLITKSILSAMLISIFFSCRNREEKKEDLYTMTYKVDGTEYKGKMIVLIDSEGDKCKTKSYRIEDAANSALVEIVKATTVDYSLKQPTKGSCEMGVGLYAFGGVFTATEGKWTVTNNNFTLVCKLVDIQTLKVAHTIEASGTLPQ